jgi:putative membrane protein
VSGAQRTRLPVTLLALVALALVVSGVQPYDRLTWFMEVAPVLIAAPLLIATRRGFPLTPLVYWLIAIHSLILVLGGHYTYARVPLGFWMQDWFDLARNHYDRIGHVAQGFVPAMIAREILLRRSPLVRGKWLFFLVLCVCMFVSVFYEFIEWWIALIAEGASIEFLGTQGDVWDTHWDMFLAFCGAILGQVLLARVHDRQLGSVA